MAKHYEGNINLNIVRGEDYTAEIAWLTNEDNPINISGPATMDIRDSSKQLILALDSGVDGELKISSASGIIQIVILSQVTLTLIAGSYNYDLFAKVDIDSNLIDGGEQIRRVLHGRVLVSDSVTQTLP